MFGVYAPGRSVAHLTYDGLYALQHRGQESAGMAVSDGTDMVVVKDMGLVTNVFNEYKLAGLQGHLAIGHTRYSTTGLQHLAQRPAGVPLASTRPGFALGHNGNLTNTEALAAEAGMLPGVVTSDSDLIAELLARHLDGHPERRPGRCPRTRCCPTLEGAFSLVLIDHDRLIGVRDPNGFRPLCLGRLDADGGWVLASETPALDIVGAPFVRELEPGELLVIDADGHRSLRPVPGRADRPQAVPLRVRVPGPARQPALRRGAARRAPAHGRAAGRPGPGRRPTW